VYKRDNQRIKKLDFAKGKADQGETDVDCAAREVAEEIGYNIRPNLNQDHYIKMETMQGKIVKLFLVTDVDKKQVQDDHAKLLQEKPYQKKKYVEAQRILWMSTEEFLKRTLHSVAGTTDEYDL